MVIIHSIIFDNIRNRRHDYEVSRNTKESHLSRSFWHKLLIIRQLYEANKLESSNPYEHRTIMFAIIHVDGLDCDTELFHVWDKLQQYSHKTMYTTCHVVTVIGILCEHVLGKQILLCESRDQRWYFSKANSPSWIHWNAHIDKRAFCITDECPAKIPMKYKGKRQLTTPFEASYFSVFSDELLL